MGKENYRLLGLDESATDEEVDARYETLKAQYNEDKWKDGEEGTAAARALEKLDAAYAEIKEERAKKKRASGDPAAYEEVSAAIRAGDLTRAQRLLDEFPDRPAEWHYLQSVVFYRKNWLNESKKQLEIALQLDGGNEKYRTAYEKMKARAEYTTQTGGAPNTNPNPNPAPGGEQMGGNWCTNCFTLCYTWLCVDCLFNLCCGCR